MLVGLSLDMEPASSKESKECPTPDTVDDTEYFPVPVPFQTSIANSLGGRRRFKEKKKQAMKLMSCTHGYWWQVLFNQRWKEENVFVLPYQYKVTCMLPPGRPRGAVCQKVVPLQNAGTRTVHGPCMDIRGHSCDSRWFLASMLRQLSKLQRVSLLRHTVTRIYMRRCMYGCVCHSERGW